MTVNNGDEKEFIYFTAGRYARFSLASNSCSNSLKCLRYNLPYCDQHRNPSDPGSRLIICWKIKIKKYLTQFLN